VIEKGGHSFFHQNSKTTGYLRDTTGGKSCQAKQEGGVSEELKDGHAMHLSHRSEGESPPKRKGTFKEGRVIEEHTKKMERCRRREERMNSHTSQSLRGGLWDSLGSVRSPGGAGKDWGYGKTSRKRANTFKGGESRQKRKNGPGDEKESGNGVR